MSDAGDLAGQRCVAVTTYGRGGEPVATPAWVVGLGDGRLGLTVSTASGLTQRLADDPRAGLQPCGARGEPLPGTAPSPGTAETVRSGPLFDEVRDRVRAKYGVRWQLGRARSALRRTPFADAVVLVRLDDH